MADHGSKKMSKGKMAKSAAAKPMQQGMKASSPTSSMGAHTDAGPMKDKGSK